MKMNKILIFSMILGYSFLSQAFLNCKSGSSESVTLAKGLYDDVAKLYNDRIAKKTELLRAAIFLSEARLCTQSIDTNEFCKIVMPQLQELNNSRSTYGSLNDRLEAMALLIEGKSLCEK